MGIGPRISRSSLGGRPHALKYDEKGYISSCSAADAARRAAARARLEAPAETPRMADPSRWSVLRSALVNERLIVMAHYPDATSYEGVKIMLFDYGVRLNDLHRQGKLDPHFCRDAEFIHPIARFEPTDRGWAMAEAVANSGAGA